MQKMYPSQRPDEKSITQQEAGRKVDTATEHSQAKKVEAATTPKNEIDRVA